MHLSSSFAVILCTVLFSQYVYCSPKSDEQWWHNLTGLDTKQISQWTTLDSKPTPKPTPLSNRFLKRSSASFDDETDSPVRSRSRNWEKSYARRRDFDNTWKNDKPVRERFSETEWDDDVPVRHVFRDSTSSIDEGPTRNRFGDELQRDKMSRPWSRGDSWNNNNNNNNNNNRNSNNNNNNNRNHNNLNTSNKPKATTSTSKQPKSDRSDRVLNLGLNFQDEDSKRKDRERLDKLAKQIFGSMEGVDTGDGEGVNLNSNSRSSANSRSNGNGVVRTNGNNGVSSGFGSNRNNGNNNGVNSSVFGRSNGNSNGSTFRSSTAKTNGNTGNGYVSNALPSFTRTAGNTMTSTRSDILRNPVNDKKSDKQVFNKFSTNTNSSPIKPKFNVVNTTPAKAERTSNTAKPITANDIRGVAEKPKSSTTPSAPVFGWRSSVNHSGDKNQKLQNNDNEDNVSTNEDEEEEDDFVDDIDDDLDDTTPTTTTTRAPIRIGTAIRTTLRPTTMKAGVEYTTNRFSDTTRPQTTVTNRPYIRETTVTTSRPKTTSTKTSTKTSTNSLSDSLSPNKKQHRMGSWVDSETLDYVEGENEDYPENDERIINAPAPQAQPLVGEEEYDDEQLPERVEAEAPIRESFGDSKFARQSAREDEDDGGGGESGRLEDALPGVPGTDYPTFATIPRTNFDCRTHEWPGYYADVETQCQVFHICQTGGRKNSFLCPNGTMFNQALFVCDWWHNVQCGDSSTFYPLNENIYDHNWESKRINSETDGNIKRSGVMAEPLTATTTETPEADSEGDDSPDSLEKRSDTDSNPVDGPNDDFVDEEETEKAPLMQRSRSPIRIYRTSRIITDPDRQKRRRRKRGYLKN